MSYNPVHNNFILIPLLFVRPVIFSNLGSNSIQRFLLISTSFWIKLQPIYYFDLPVGVWKYTPNFGTCVVSPYLLSLSITPTA